MKQTVLKLLHAAGAFAPFRMANRDKALILTYHRFSQAGGGGTTSASAFAEQLNYLTTHYRVVPLSSLAEHLSSGESLPAGIASISIDDGYRDAYEIAFPILRNHDVPATLFVVSKFVDRSAWLWTDKLRFLADSVTTERLKIAIGNCIPQLKLYAASGHETATQVNSTLKHMPDDLKEKIILEIASSIGVGLPDLPPDEYAPITWEQAREMDDAGVQIGSHTVTHPILTTVNDERLRAELRDSRSRIETVLGRKVDLFCYPNGDYDHRVLGAVRAAGYSCAVTVDDGLNGFGNDVYRLRRVHADNNFARFIQCTSGFEEVKNRLVYARRGAAAGVSN